MSDDHAIRREGFLENGTYLLRRRVSWGECDAAGIVYTPRFLEWMVTTIEQFFHEVLQSPWETLRNRGLASPFVSTTLAFQAPIRVGEDLELVLRVGNIGRTSVGWLIGGRVAERDCFAGTATTVFVGIASEAPTRIPENLLLLLRRRPTPHLAGTASE
jgi:YbgC/YbaW family acyl-CoA thioester hydrolase